MYSMETDFMSTGSSEQLEQFRVNTKNVFDVFIPPVYHAAHDEMDFDS